MVNRWKLVNNPIRKQPRPCFSRVLPCYKCNFRLWDSARCRLDESFPHKVVVIVDSEVTCHRAVTFTVSQITPWTPRHGEDGAQREAEGLTQKRTRMGRFDSKLSHHRDSPFWAVRPAGAFSSAAAEMQTCEMGCSSPVSPSQSQEQKQCAQTLLSEIGGDEGSGPSRGQCRLATCPRVPLSGPHEMSVA